MKRVQPGPCLLYCLFPIARFFYFIKPQTRWVISLNRVVALMGVRLLNIRVVMAVFSVLNLYGTQTLFHDSLCLF